MDLDNLPLFARLDSQGIRRHIDALPDQIETAWALGQALPLPNLSDLTHIAVCGAGAMATGAAVAASVANPHCRIPLTLHRTDTLPAWVAGPQALVLALSHTGHDPEPLAALTQAAEHGARVAAITTGGPLAEACTQAGGVVWAYAHGGPASTALAFAVALPLALLSRGGLIPNPADDIAGAVQALRGQQQRLRAESPVTRNPAKRMAGQFMDRNVLLFGSGFMAPVARRWREQAAAMGKAWAQFEELPDALHAGLAGLQYPEALIPKFMALFLETEFDSPQDQQRLQDARLLMMTSGFNTDSVRAVGPSPLAQLLTAVHYGDYVSYYLAMAYETDPAPVEVLER
ncbi:MAG: hypothetical protein HY679_08380 [Chloroflexi bacterium]|nr:hypothetical protein [Chloroflexota bacterium]